ncbi:MAG: hypothetical protein ACYSW0_24940, partial [Planctomycetota bacterium]
KTTLAQLAAKVTQLETPIKVSAEAIHQRMSKHAVTFLKDMIRQALAKVQALDDVCGDHLFDSFTGTFQERGKVVDSLPAYTSAITRFRRYPAP